MRFSINRRRFVLTSTTILVLMLVAIIITTLQSNLHYNTIDIKSSDYSIHETNTTAALHVYNSKEYWLQYHNSDQTWKMHSYDVSTGHSNEYNLNQMNYHSANILQIADDMVYIQWIESSYANTSLTLTMNNTISVYSTDGIFQYSLIQPVSTTFPPEFINTVGHELQFSLSDQLLIHNSEFYLSVNLIYNYGIIALYNTNVYYAKSTLEHIPTLLATIPNVKQNASLFTTTMKQTSNQMELVVTRITVIPRTTIIEEYALSSSSIREISSKSYNVEIGAIDFVDSEVIGWTRARDLENLDNLSLQYRFTDFSSNSEAIVDTGMRQVTLLQTSNVENMLVFYGTGIDHDFNRTYVISTIDIRSGKLHAENIKLPVSKDLNFLVITSINKINRNIVVSGVNIEQKNIIVVFGKGYSPGIILPGLTPALQYLIIGSILILIDLGVELLRGRTSQSAGDLQYPNTGDL